jgi:hypothetical protein
MTSQRQERFFNAYMQKAKAGLRINVHQEMLARVTGGPATPGLPPMQFPNQ